MGGTIETTILSILNQTFKDFELIVVDDGSTDNTQSVISQFLKGGLRYDHRVIYITQSNKGKLAALNTAVEKCSGDFITIVDADDTLPQDSVEIRVGALQTALQTSQDVVGVYGDATYVRGRNVHRRRGRQVHSLEEVLMAPLTPIIGPSVLARKKAILEFYPFDTEFTRVNDKYLQCGLLRQGGLVYIPEVVYTYNLESKTTSERIRARIITLLNMNRLISHYCGGPQKYLAQLIQTSYNLFKLVFEIFTSAK